MKKLLAIILSIICAFSCFASVASAAAGSVIGEVAETFLEGMLGMEFEEDTPLGYGVIYDTDALSGVSVVYKPKPTLSFENPGIYTITNDTPLSIDYEFICWEDKHGNHYYAGDKIYVDGMIYLTPVWAEKDDGDVRVARIVKTTFEALRRIIASFFGILDTVVNFEYTPKEPGRYDLTLNGIYYEPTPAGQERVILYVDSDGIHKLTKMERIEISAESKAEVYLCTGWNEATLEPLNASETYELPYGFAESKGPKNEDVLYVMTGDLVEDYATSDNCVDSDKYYMVVTVNDSLYNSSKEDTGLEFDEYCTPVSVVFTFTK